MTVSDQLAKLSARAKQAEAKTAAAGSQARADLTKAVQSAHKSTQAQAQKLKAAADADTQKISYGWNDVQNAWSAHLTKMHDNAEARRERHDQKKAERAAQDAEADALYAIDYAYAAIQEAESATLDAILARRDADDLTAG